MLFNKWGAGNPINPHPNSHTRITSVHEPLDNDDGWNQQFGERAFLGRIKKALPG